jgi:hypothetical protein
LRTVEDSLGWRPLLTQLPIYGDGVVGGGALVGVVDLVNLETILWPAGDGSDGRVFSRAALGAGDAMHAAAVAARAALVESLSEYDDEVMEAFVGAGVPSCKTFSRTVCRLYGGAKGLAVWY